MHKASTVALFIMAEKMAMTSPPNNREMVTQVSVHPLGDTLLSHLHDVHDKLPITSKSDNLLMLILATHLVVDYKNGHKSFCLDPFPYNRMLQNLLSRESISPSLECELTL